MSHQPLINATIDYVKKELSNAEGGHDWFHIERVFKTAQTIGEQEKANLLVVSLAALLHDIADSKFHDGDEALGPKMAKAFLQNQNVDATTIDHVVAIIENISFKGGKQASKIDSLEFKVVQDADRLDALGAIGIARCFNYGGFKNRALYDPSIAPNMDMTKEEYKQSKAPTINHFYEKLLLLKDRMHTTHGKKMAQKRHFFMESYLDQFYNEWEGKH
ncbi:MAG: HD domain-containing protein [Gilvibacter sp.]